MNQADIEKIFLETFSTKNERLTKGENMTEQISSQEIFNKIMQHQKERALIDENQIKDLLIREIYRLTKENLEKTEHTVLSDEGTRTWAISILRLTLEDIKGTIEETQTRRAR